jgi:hypothetical protein
LRPREAVFSAPLKNTRTIASITLKQGSFDRRSA